MAGAPSFVSAGARSQVAGDVLVPALPDHIADDILLLEVETANEPVVLTDTGGFLEVENSPQANGTPGGTGATRLTVFWLRATSSNMSPPTIANPGDHTVAGVASFRGCRRTGVPWSYTSGDQSASTTSVAIPGGLTITPNSLVVAMATNRVDNSTGQFGTWINGDLTSVTERINYGSNLGNGGGVAMTTGVKATTGSFGGTFAVLTNTGEQARHVMVLLPADDPPLSRYSTDRDWLDPDWVARLNVR